MQVQKKVHIKLSYKKAACKMLVKLTPGAGDFELELEKWEKPFFGVWPIFSRPLKCEEEDLLTPPRDEKKLLTVNFRLEL